MLGTKNRCSSGKYSFALTLQQCDLHFFNISEIGVSERVGKEVGFQHVTLPIGALVCSSVPPPPGQISKRENVILSRI